MDTVLSFESLWAISTVVLFVGVSLLLLYEVAKWSGRLLHQRYLRKREMVWLEITPPSSIEKTLESTEQLFSVIHGTYAARFLGDKLLRRSAVMSFEITSTKADGVRYLVHTEKQRSRTMQKVITSYLPSSKIREVAYLPLSSDIVSEYTQQSHYVLPLALPNNDDERDPLSYVTGAMTKLSGGEQVTLQLVVSPVRLKEASVLSRKIIGNDNILDYAQSLSSTGSSGAVRVPLAVLTGVVKFLGSQLYGMVYGYDGGSSEPVLQSLRTLSSVERELMETMHHKVSRPLFSVDLRVLVTSPHVQSHQAALTSALDGFSQPPYQAVRRKSSLPLVRRVVRQWSELRLPSLRPRSRMVLSTTELAGLFHFPSSRISRTDNLISSLSRTLPAPVSLKSGRTLSVLLGENHHHGVVTPIGLSEEERERHVYMIGGTGNGKTTMLFHAILQDIQAGNGVAVVDPHGDLAESLLRHIPEERISDVIYMNPDDLAYSIGINLLELDEGLTGDDVIREKDIITESTISVFRKIFSDDDTVGHRIEYVLRNTIQTALATPNPTLFTVYRLLNDAHYRRDVVNQLEDEDLFNFWKYEVGKAGDFQRVKMSSGITAKIGRFLFSGSAKRMLEQEKSTIDFTEVLNTKKILICNFSKGILGEDTSTLFGTTVLTRLQLAALRRARESSGDRVPFYLYVDEFQNFATLSFVQMLSEARKYKLLLTMAEQSTSQQAEQRLVQIILANVGTVVCFRSGSPADEKLVLPLFMPFIQPGEIANLPAYSYYVRIAAITSQEPMSGVTVVSTEVGRPEVMKKVIASSRQRYARVTASASESSQKTIVTSAAVVSRVVSRHAQVKVADSTPFE